MKKQPLIPPDTKQCQAQRKEGCWPDAQHFMIIGPAQLVRCTNKPTVIVKEVRPSEDGRRGSMSLCDACYQVFLKQNGTGFATCRPILWDVFIYEYKTRKIESVAGTNLPESGSFHTVEKRLDTVVGRLNDNYGVIAVPAGTHKKGDVLSKNVQTYEGESED